MNSLSDDLCTHICTFLEKCEIPSFSVNKRLIKDCRANAVWKRLVWVEYEMDARNKVNPPGFSPPCANLDCRLDSFEELRQLGWYELYVRWRSQFQGYTAREVSLGRLWWLRMERWLLANGGIDIFNTLNPPATEDYIDQIDLQLRSSAIGVRPGISLPRNLRILYRFHDGQNLALHEVRLRTRKAKASFHMLRSTMCTDHPERSLLEKQMTLGLFGGVSFYDTNIVCSMLPLEHFKAARDLTFGPHAHRLVVHVQDMDDGSSSFSPAVDMVAVNDDIGPASLGPQDCVVFAINSSSWEDINNCHKVFLVDNIDHRTGDSLGDVYTNLSNNDHRCTFTPCVDYRRMAPTPIPSLLRSSHSCKSGITGSLWDWLFEYSRRLDQRRFRLEPPNMCEANADSFLMISHFQSPPEATPSPTSLGSKSARSSPVYELPSSRLRFFEEQSNSLLGRSVVGSDGVETTFCPSFIANLSRMGDPNDLTWTYSIRLRLLQEVKIPYDLEGKKPMYEGTSLYDTKELHNSSNWLLLENEGLSGGTSYHYVGSQKNCSLTRRHWIITTPSEDGPSEDVVDGEGVIGLFPELVRGKDETMGLNGSASHFGYQSMSRSNVFPNTFAGHLSFIDDTHTEFTSRISTITLTVPTFIY